jgi:hypothetical protein
MKGQHQPPETQHLMLLAWWSQSHCIRHSPSSQRHHSLPRRLQQRLKSQQAHSIRRTRCHDSFGENDQVKHCVERTEFIQDGNHGLRNGKLYRACSQSQQGIGLVKLEQVHPYNFERNCTYLDRAKANV